MKPDIVIDTDPGHDDAMALMLGIMSQKLEIKAITTVCGNSTIQNTTRNAQWALDLLQCKKIPIYSGSAKPLKRPLIQAIVHGKSGLAGITARQKPILNGLAVKKIIELTQRGNLTIIALGPLTNIAKAILKNPRAMKKIKEIIIMGGAIRVPGNKNRVAEFNFFVDPEAADIVLKFPVKKTIIPLDACNDIQLKMSDFKKIQNKRIRNALLKIIKPYIQNICSDEGVRAALMYDVLTVYYLLNPKKCTTKKYNIQIEKNGILTRGMSVAELRKTKKEKPNTVVVEYIPKKDFVQKFIHTLSKRSYSKKPKYLNN